MRILFFSPHSETWVHAFPEAVVAEFLEKFGNEVLYVSCGGALTEGCVPMLSHGIMPSADKLEKYKICQKCKENDRLIRSSMHLSGPRIIDLISDEDRAQIENLIETSHLFNIENLEYKNVKIGKISLYQFMIRHKIINLDFSLLQMSEFKSELKNTLFAVIAGERLIKDYCPDRIIVYNALYSVNHAIIALAEMKGIPTYFLHAGNNFSSRLQSLIVGKKDIYYFYNRLICTWQKIKDKTCCEGELRAVTDHFISLIRSDNVFIYSAPRNAKLNLRELYKISPEKKVLVATLSSYDELIAAQMSGFIDKFNNLLFSDQSEWLDSIIDYVSARENYVLIIRVHPREFPNRREGTLSEHASLLVSKLAKLPKNVIVNWPDEQISVYDFIDVADIFLNAWSAVGREMSVLGIPVVVYAPQLLLYPSDINIDGSQSRDVYFQSIESALSEGWSLERARRAYRWSVLELERSAISIADSFKGNEKGKITIFRRILLRLISPINKEFSNKYDCLRRSKNLNAGIKINNLLKFDQETFLLSDLHEEKQDVPLDVETSLLKNELKRLAENLYPDLSSREASVLYKRLSDSL